MCVPAVCCPVVIIRIPHAIVTVYAFLKLFSRADEIAKNLGICIIICAGSQATMAKQPFSIENTAFLSQTRWGQYFEPGDPPPEIKNGFNFPTLDGDE
jgi:hypothetical protein